MGGLILLRVILSASASAVQKRLLLDRAGVYHTWILTYALVLLPTTILAVWNATIRSHLFWRDIALGGALDAAGNLLMVAALRVTDLSVFGPLNAIRPILALVFGWAFLHETPSSLGLIGVGVTVAGGVILFGEPKKGSVSHWRELWRPLVLRVGGLSFGVIGAVFLKRAALQATTDVTVAAWTASGLLVLCASALHRPGEFRTLGTAARAHVPWLMLHAIVFGTMQWITIRIFETTLLAYSFVYFQLGMVLQVFLGKIFFKERAFGRRLLASAIMAGGSILVLWKG